MRQHHKKAVRQAVEHFEADPGAETVDAYRGCLLGFVGAHALAEGWIVRCLEDREWTCRRGVAPVDEW
ncbi:MAG: hypothetical protein ACYS1C_10000 [Planctomycetota bacterium]|jgi:hypothetical protein